MQNSISQKQLRRALEDELFRRGDLRFLIPESRSGQKRAYEFVRATHSASPNSAAPIILNTRRGLGKSFLSAILAWETCLRIPRASVIYLGPSLTQALGILNEATNFLFDHCPPDVAPERKKGGEVYEFKNGSKFKIFGARDGAEHLRGLRAHAVFVDEVASFENAAYIARDIVVPLFSGRDSPLYVHTTTPPRSTGHIFCTDLVPAAQRDNRYLAIPCTEDSAFDKNEEAKMLSVFRSKESVAWRREMMCELVADFDSLVFPSFEKNKLALIGPTLKPPAFFPFVAADLGYVDATGVVFGLIDFGEQRLKILDEICAPSLGTTALSNLLKYKTDLHFGDSIHNPVMVADATPRELDDLRQSGVYFQAARSNEGKWDKSRGLAYLESLFASHKIQINPACSNLLFQLSNCLKNERGDDIKREKRRQSASPGDAIVGHYDAAMALVYGAWKMRHRWSEDPFPYLPLSSNKIYRTPSSLLPSSPFATADFGTVRDETF